MLQDPQQRRLASFATAGIEFFATFALLLGVGILLDCRLGTLPGFTLTGGALGFAAATYRLVRQALRLQRGERQSTCNGRKDP